jgi:urease accessory protein
MTYGLARASIAIATLVASAQAADAHIVASRLGDFYTGALHPLTDLQDLILWVAMGVLAGSLGASKGRWLVLAFPLGLLAGLVLGRTTGFVSAGPAADAGMILVLGLLLAAAPRIPTAPLCAIAFGLAVMRGAANAGDVGSDTNRLLFAAGLACMGYAAITLTMAVTLAFRRPDAGASTAWRGIAIRAFGGWIAAIGLMMVGFAFASHSL